MRLWLTLLALSGLVWLVDGKGYSAKMTQPLRKKVYQEQVSESKVNQWRAKVAIGEAELSKVKSENERLRELLEAPLSPSWQFVPAKVLSLKNNIMKIDVGSKMGVLKDQVVMGYVKESINNGLVIGRILSVNLFESEVELLRDEEMQVKVKTESGVVGVVKGDGGKITLEEVLQKSSLVKDELLLTQAGDGWLPDLVIGRVGEVFKEETAVFQSSEIRLLVDPGSLSEVWVVSR